MSAAGSAEWSVAVRSLRRLIRLQNPDGSFFYKYDPAKSLIPSAEYNVVRHAGCAYALSWALSLDDLRSEEGLESAARLAIEYLIRRLKDYGSGLYVSECGRDIGNLGATALLSCALSFEPLRSDHTDLYLTLRFSLSNAQRDDGSFVCRLNAPASEAERGWQYYPGETLLALSRYFECGMESPMLPQILRRAFEYYRRRFQSAPHTGMVLWHADAWTRLHRLSRVKPSLASLRTADYLNFALHLVGWVLPYQLKSPAITGDLVGGFCFGTAPGIATASFVEALLRVDQALFFEGRDKCVRVYERHIESGLQFVSRLHYSADHLSRDVWHWTAGGTPASFTRKRFRMDNDQHVITMCLTAMETVQWLADLRGQP